MPVHLDSPERGTNQDRDQTQAWITAILDCSQFPCEVLPMVIYLSPSRASISYSVWANR